MRREEGRDSGMGGENAGRLFLHLLRLTVRKGKGELTKRRKSQ